MYASNLNKNIKIDTPYYHAARLKNLKKNRNTLSKRDLQSKKNKVLQLAYLIMTLIIRMDDKKYIFHAISFGLCANILDAVVYI